MSSWVFEGSLRRWERCPKRSNRSRGPIDLVHRTHAAEFAVDPTTAQLAGPLDRSARGRIADRARPIALIKRSCLDPRAEPSRQGHCAHGPRSGIPGADHSLLRFAMLCQTRPTADSSSRKSFATPARLRARPRSCAESRRTCLVQALGESIGKAGKSVPLHRP